MSKHSKIILFIFSFKLLLSGLFTSPFYYDVYVPFLKKFNLVGYEAWSDNLVNFPYSPMLTLIIFLFFKIGSLFDSVYFENILYHIPILLADYFTFKYLNKFLPKLKKETLYLYAISPIVFYASYIYSQHDLIPTALVFISSYYLSRKKFSKAFILYGLAISVKWHVVITLPLFLVFTLYRGKSYQKLIKYTLFSLLPLIITLLPFGSLESAMLLFQLNESNLIYKTFIPIRDLKVYLFPFIYALLITWYIRFKRFNSELLIGLSAILFLLFILVVYPNPGWFLWSLPFLTYSFVKYSRRKLEVRLLYLSLSTVYLIFFLFCYKHPISNISNLNFLGSTINFTLENIRFKNLVFTLLICLFSIATYIVYLSSIKNSIVFKRRFKAFLIGIAGDSGSGKSTLLNSITNVLGSNSSVNIEGDGEHKWERGHENWYNYTHLNPKANNLHLQLSHLINLKKGIVTKRSDYNHTTGKFDQTKRLKPKDFIIIAGLHPFYLKGARNQIDFKIYLDTDDELRKNWKISRDIKKRGYSEEKVLQQILDRKKDSQNYIMPQKGYADLIISYSPKSKIENYTEKVDVRNIQIKFFLNTDINVDPLIQILESAGISEIFHKYEENFIRQSLEINYNQINTEIIYDEFNEFMESMDLNSLNMEQSTQGISQIVILYCIREIITGESLE